MTGTRLAVTALWLALTSAGCAAIAGIDDPILAGDAGSDDATASPDGGDDTTANDGWCNPQRRAPDARIP